MLAAGLAERGIDVVMLESGPYVTRKDFVELDERWALASLYQDCGGRSTADQAITVLQAVVLATRRFWTFVLRSIIVLERRRRRRCQRLQ